MKYVFGALLLTTFLNASAAAQETLLVGVDETGKAFEVSVENSRYKGRLTEFIAGTANSTLPVLNTLSPEQRWQMHTVVVGIGVNFEIGLDSILHLGITPRFRAAFTKFDEPIVP